jgi:hypothetical protein
MGCALQTSCGPQEQTFEADEGDTGDERDARLVVGAGASSGPSNPFPHKSWRITTKAISSILNIAFICL